MSLAALAGTRGAQRSQGGVKKGVKEKGGRESKRRGMDGRLTFHMIPIDGDLINPYFTPAENF